MSVSIYVTGFAPPDEQWKKMKAIWDSCRAAKIAVPRDVEKFFNDDVPDDKGVEVKLPVRKWNTEYANGFELDVDAIPKHVKTLRFYRA